MEFDYTEEDAYECPECGGSVDLTKDGMFDCENGCDLGNHIDCEGCGEELVELPETRCESCKG